MKKGTTCKEKGVMRKLLPAKGWRSLTYQKETICTVAEFQNKWATFSKVQVTAKRFFVEPRPK